MGAIAAALAVASPLPGIPAAAVRAPRKKTPGNKSKSSSFDRRKGMIWVGGKWLFFRP